MGPKWNGFTWGTLFGAQGGWRLGAVLRSVLLLWLQRLLVGRRAHVCVPSVKFRLSEMDVRGRTHKSGRMGSRNVNLHPDTVRVEWKRWAPRRRVGRKLLAGATSEPQPATVHYHPLTSLSCCPHGLRPLHFQPVTAPRVLATAPLDGCQ